MNVAATLNNLRQLPPEQVFALATRVLPPWVAAALVVALALKLGQLTWLLIPLPEDATIAAPVATAGLAQPGRGAPSGEALVRAVTQSHLFGQFNAPSIPQPPKDLPVAGPTQLNLKLVGTLAANDEKEAMAIIVDGRGDARVYMIGDSIQQGVSLHAVYPSEAHIRNNGQIESLPLPRETDLASGTAPRRTARANTRASRQTASDTARLTEALAANPQKLTELIRPQPVFSDGRQLGYRVYPGRNRQQFSRLGLKPGDLVTQINGSPLDDPAKGLEIFRALEESTQVSVTVERNGESQVLVLDTSVLESTGQDSSDE